MSELTKHRTLSSCNTATVPLANIILQPRFKLTHLLMFGLHQIHQDQNCESTALTLSCATWQNCNHLILQQCDHAGDQEETHWLVHEFAGDLQSLRGQGG